MKKFALLFLSLIVCLTCQAQAKYGQVQELDNSGRWVPSTNLPSASPWINLADFAVNNLAKQTCSFTSGSATITCSGATFTSGDNNKIGILYGARANGSGATATTTLSGGAITTPSVTGAGSGYLTVPTATISGLTCTYNPELKVVLSGSNYVTGNTVSSITVVYGGVGCTGSPTITITASPALSLPLTITSASGTTFTMTNNGGGGSVVKPSVSSSGTLFYETDNTSAINTAITTFGGNSGSIANPTGIICDRFFLTSGAIQFINKSVNVVSPSVGNPGAIGSSNLGCGFLLANQSFTVPTSVIYLGGIANSHFDGMTIDATSGNMQTADIEIQNNCCGVNTTHNTFTNNLIGPVWDGDPEIGSPCNQEAVCAGAQRGIYFDPTTSGNEEQFLFSQNRVAGQAIGVEDLNTNATEEIFDHLIEWGDAVGMKLVAQILCRMCNISSASDSDFVMGDSSQSATTTVSLTLDDFVSEQSHQFIRAEHGSSINFGMLFMHGRVSYQLVSGFPIQSGTLVDFSGLGISPFIVADHWLDISGNLPSGVAPLNYNLGASTTGTGAQLQITGADFGDLTSAPNFTGIAPLSGGHSASNLGLYARSYWPQYGNSGVFCQTNMIEFYNSPDTQECNNTSIQGKLRVYGQILGTALGAPVGTLGRAEGGGSGTNYYYKVSGVADGIPALPSSEITISNSSSLSSTHYNEVCVTAIAGAQAYNFYEAASSGSEKLLSSSPIAADALVVDSGGSSAYVCYNDLVGGAGGANPPSVDGTGGTTLAGPLVLNGTTSGSATLSATATGGTLNLGSTNATVSSAGALTITSCSGCGGGSGLSGMTGGQVPIAATASTVTSSEALAGAGAAITTGPTSDTSGHVTDFTGTAGQIADSGVVAANLVVASSPGAGVAHFAGSTQSVTSSAVTSADATGNTSGSGNFVLVTSPTLITPALGTPSALVLTNATSLPCGAMPALTGAVTTSAGACATSFQSSPSFTTPNIGAATGTSLLLTGLLDGTVPVTVTTGTTGTPGGTYNTGYVFNQEGTAGTGVNYTLPTAAAGKQYCMANSYNGSAANTGVLTITTSATGQFIIFTDGTLSATGGNVTSGGAAADSACVVGVDSTHWQLFTQSGTWTKH